MTNSLKPGCDCLGEIRYFDVELADGSGEPYTISQAICLHEEDSGLLWKHFDATLGTTETRRSRRLVISFIVTADNYKYAIYWYFYQDGLTCRAWPPRICALIPSAAPTLPLTQVQAITNVSLDER